MNDQTNNYRERIAQDELEARAEQERHDAERFVTAKIEAGDEETARMVADAIEQVLEGTFDQDPILSTSVAITGPVEYES